MVTAMADVFVTHIAACHALAAEVTATRVAVTAAGITQVVLALFARVAVFGVDQIATVRAPHSMPILERHVRAAAVVSLQNIVDDQKEVGEAALL